MKDPFLFVVKAKEEKYKKLAKHNLHSPSFVLPNLEKVLEKMKQKNGRNKQKKVFCFRN